MAKSPPGAHFVEGTIEYSPEHAESLGWDVQDRSDRMGKILVVKPVVAGDEPLDIRYYSQHNRAFPQQSTADQFFNEAQFESYRRLGELSATAASAAILKVLGP